MFIFINSPCFCLVIMLCSNKEAEMAKLSWVAGREVSCTSPDQREWMGMGRIPAHRGQGCFFKEFIGSVLSPRVVQILASKAFGSWQELKVTIFSQVSHWRCWGSRYHSTPVSLLISVCGKWWRLPALCLRLREHPWRNTALKDLTWYLALFPQIPAG